MVHELLGEGNFGKVYRGEVKSAVNTPSTKCPTISSSGLVVAVKLLKRELARLRMYVRMCTYVQYTA